MKDIYELEDFYQNGPIKIGDVLIKPCLSLCFHYRRGTGFFSSSALKSYVSSFDNIINEKTKIDILCSPVVTDKALIRILGENKTDDEKRETIRKHHQNIALYAIGYERNENERSYRNKLLAYMIAKNILEIRFAIPKKFDLVTDEPNEKNLYHVKNGYFEFPDETKIAFNGSFNESESGHHSHIDNTLVFRSFVESEKEKLKKITNSIDKDWEEKNEYIRVYKLSNETLKIIKKLSPKARPIAPSRRREKIPINIDKSHKQKVGPQEVKLPKDIWKHKKDAILKFLEKKNGILEMATGTGKTSTALEIIRQLYLSEKIESIIISVYGNDLLTQWCNEIKEWKYEHREEKINQLMIWKSFKDNQDSLAFNNSPKNSILVIGRNDPDTIKGILTGSTLNKEKTIIIHDEIHGFGSAKNVEKLSGSHKNIAYKLGLSATPEREYGDGNDFIKTEIGKIIFEYPLEQAIKDGVLCEFDYIPLNYKLTENDKQEKKKVYAAKAQAEKDGRPWSDEQLRIRLAKVNKKAELKPSILDDYLKSYPDTLKSCIVFVADKEQGDSVCKVIVNYTQKYKPYYEGTHRQYLDMLSTQKIDCLVACQRLDEGIDIKSLKNIILVSSDKAKLTTVQRIGRCIRTNPNDKDKKSIVVDFILENTNESPEKSGTDQDRVEWLKDVSATRKK